MPSTQNVVVLVRIAGSVFAVERIAGKLRVVKVGTYRVSPPDQAGALEVLRGHSGGLLFAGRDEHVGPLEQSMRGSLDGSRGVEVRCAPLRGPSANRGLGYAQHVGGPFLAAGPFAEVVESRHGVHTYIFCKAMQAAICDLCNADRCEL